MEIQVQNIHFRSSCCLVPTHRTSESSTHRDINIEGTEGPVSVEQGVRDKGPRDGTEGENRGRTDDEVCKRVPVLPYRTTTTPPSDFEMVEDWSLCPSQTHLISFLHGTRKPPTKSSPENRGLWTRVGPWVT